jgi:Holliday junction resolvasome RuvABC endonuclease subunit
MTNDELRTLRFSGLDLSPNHYGLITLDGLGQLVNGHYLVGTKKGADLAKADDRFTSTLYRHPSAKQNPDSQYKDAARIATVSADVADVIEAHGSQFLALEDYAWDAGGREYQIGEVAGAVKRDFWEVGLPFRLHANTAVKMFAAKNGNASKEAVMAAVEERWEPELFMFCTGASKRQTEGDLCDAYVLARLCLVEYKLRKGLMQPSHLGGKEWQVFMRVTKSQPVNVLGREWITRPDSAVE